MGTVIEDTGPRAGPRAVTAHQAPTELAATDPQVADPQVAATTVADPPVAVPVAVPVPTEFLETTHPPTNTAPPTAATAFQLTPAKTPTSERRPFQQAELGPPNPL